MEETTQQLGDSIVARYRETARVRPPRRKRNPGDATAQFAREIERRWTAMLPQLVSEILVWRLGAMQNRRPIVAGTPVSLELPANSEEQSSTSPASPSEKSSLATADNGQEPPHKGQPVPAQQKPTQAIPASAAQAPATSDLEQPLARPLGPTQHHSLPDAPALPAQQTAATDSAAPVISSAPSPATGNTSIHPAQAQVKPTVQAAPAGSEPSPDLIARPPGYVQRHAQNAVTTNAPQPASGPGEPVRSPSPSAVAGATPVEEPVGENETTRLTDAQPASQTPPVKSQPAQSAVPAPDQELIAHPPSQTPPVKSQPAQSTVPAPDQELIAHPPGERVPSVQTPSVQGTPPAVNASSEKPPATTPGAPTASAADATHATSDTSVVRVPDAASIHAPEMTLAHPAPPAMQEIEESGAAPHMEAAGGSSAVKAESPAATPRAPFIHVAARQAATPPAPAAEQVGSGIPRTPAVAVPSRQQEAQHLAPAAPISDHSRTAQEKAAPEQAVPERGTRRGESQADRDEVMRRLLKQFANEMAWEAERRGRAEWT